MEVGLDAECPHEQDGCNIKWGEWLNKKREPSQLKAWSWKAAAARRRDIRAGKERAEYHLHKSAWEQPSASDARRRMDAAAHRGREKLTRGNTSRSSCEVRQDSPKRAERSATRALQEDDGLEQFFGWLRHTTAGS